MSSVEIPRLELSFFLNPSSVQESCWKTLNSRYNIFETSLGRIAVVGKIGKCEFSASSSKDSGARYWYLGWENQNRKLLVLQDLSGNSCTSRHYHEETREEYYFLFGECQFEKGNEIIQIKPPVNYIVQPKEIHQMVTKESPCLSLIILESLTESALKSGRDKFYVKA